MAHSNSIYVIDANILIDSHRQFYHFDIAPSFWNQLGEKIIADKIILIENVTEEILVSEVEEEKDDIQLWLEGILEAVEIRATDTQEVINTYADIMNMIQQNERYESSALAQWADIKIADPWIIAFAKVHKATIVTRETKIQGGQQLKKLKIPNVAEDYGVECIDLFEMMKRLEIKL